MENESEHYDTMVDLPDMEIGHQSVEETPWVNNRQPTGVTVVEFVIMSAPPTHEQVVRPYEFRATGDSISTLADAVDESIDRNIPVSNLMSNEGWIGVSTTPTQVVSMPEGWNVKRGTFRLILDINNPTGVYRYILEGYTNYLDTSYSGHLDTDMRLYIDHVSSYQINNNTAFVTGINYIHSPVNYGTVASADSGVHTMRAGDIINSVSLIEDLNEVSAAGWSTAGVETFDTRSSISGKNVQVSTTNDLILGNYINTIVDKWIHNGIQSTLNPWGEDAGFDETNRRVITTPATHLDGLVATGATETSGTDNSISLGELIKYLNIPPEMITLVEGQRNIIVPSTFSGVVTPFGQMAPSYADANNSVDWVDTSLITTIAHTLGKQLEAAVMRHGLTSVEIGGYVTGPMPDNIDITVTNAVPATAYINPATALFSLKRYIADNIILSVSHGGTLGLSFSAIVNTYYDTRMNITISSGEHSVGPYSYVIPSYAAAATSSVVATDENVYNTAVSQAAVMRQTVEDITRYKNVEQSQGQNVLY